MKKGYNSGEYKMSGKVMIIKFCSVHAQANQEAA